MGIHVDKDPGDAWYGEVISLALPRRGYVSLTDAEGRSVNVYREALEDGDNIGVLLDALDGQPPLVVLDE